MLKLVHADALIELLSALTNDDLTNLGMTPDQVEALHDVWEASCDHYETTVGRPHPLSEPTDADDRDMPSVEVTHQNNGTIN
jgi:hypothetical protein